MLLVVELLVHLREAHHRRKGLRTGPPLALPPALHFRIDRDDGPLRLLRAVDVPALQEAEKVARDRKALRRRRKEIEASADVGASVPA